MALELGKIASTFFSRLKRTPGSSLNLEALGLGDTRLSATAAQHHGFRSNPPKDTRIIIVPIGRGRRHLFSIAELDYGVSIEIAYGATTIFSTSADGKTIKACIDLDNTGKIKISNETKSLNSILSTLIGHIRDLITINCVSGSPVTLSPTTIANLNSDITALGALLKD